MVRTSEESEPILTMEEAVGAGLSRREFAGIASSLGLVTMAGCMGDEDPDPGDVGDDDGVEPTEGGTLEVGIEVSLDSMDQHLQTQITTVAVLSQMVENLFVVEHDYTVDGKLVENIDLEDDGQRWVMDIREGVEFHPPYQKELTAEDIIYNLERVVDPDVGSFSRRPWIIESEFEQIDDYSIEMSWDETQTSVDSWIAGFHGFGIMSPESIEEGDPSNHPVGTGPYVFEEWIPRDHITMSAFDDYWGDDYPHFDEITMRPIDEPATMITELQEGSVDLLRQTPRENIPELEQDDDVVVDISEGFAYQTLDINPTTETEEGRVEEMPTVEREVRQAIAAAIDFEELVQICLSGYGVPTQNFFPEDSPWHVDYNPHPMEQDAELAEQLIDDAGYDTPLEVNLISTSEDPIYRALGRTAQGQLNQAGFDVNLDEFEFAEWAGKLFAGEFDISVDGFPGAPDPEALSGYFHIGQDDPPLFNYEFEEADRVFDLWEQGRRTTDEDERQDIYRELQELIIDDPIRLVLWHRDIVNSYTTDVGGFEAHPWDMEFRAYEAYFGE
ncbi:ABC transporter substrate-binding protein [Natrarchaeobius chitinivorans]|uniref:ABC transporter substrate-binding protein n=1 Tax=Natrarchaeobius chitinivorans TaxID=1679083 RepID=A0A3N6N729_NATCH|nr:ABC transporter substrate-binding protein [Natrarchaeobius chitinivorans]RQG94192.1 ABC transporter substrate-binding protein [Natrarchaeobius chitinivorans]